MDYTTEEKLYAVCNTVAMVAHSATGQKRKGLEKPYYIHPYSVAEKLRNLNYPMTTICAGLLHDVVEDTEISLEDLRFIIYSFDTVDGNFTNLINRTIELVDIVTDKFTPKTIEANRKDRSTLESVRILESADPDAWAVKLADISDNMKDVSGMDVPFLKVWLAEKDTLVRNMPVGRYYSKLHSEVRARLDELDAEFNFRIQPHWERCQIAFEYLSANKEDFINAYRTDKSDH